MKLRGLVHLEHFGGPVYVLRTDDARQFELRGDAVAAWIGREIVVEARPAAAAYGFSMVGPVLEVDRIVAA